MPNSGTHASGSATGDNLTTREQRTLGRFKHLGLMEYKDLDAYYCTYCEMVYNVKCAVCGVRSEYTQHLSLDGRKDEVFQVLRPLVTTKSQGLYWTPVTCRKCDFTFRVIVQ